MVNSEDLCASVSGYSNSCYRCCESTEEGYQALATFLTSQAAIPSPNFVAQNASRLAALGHHGHTAHIDDSWWCCFAGAEPGVYQGL